jgi:hypothetical protein
VFPAVEMGEKKKVIPSRINVGSIKGLGRELTLPFFYICVIIYVGGM